MVLRARVAGPLAPRAAALGPRQPVPACPGIIGTRAYRVHRDRSLRGPRLAPFPACRGRDALPDREIRQRQRPGTARDARRGRTRPGDRMNAAATDHDPIPIRLVVHQAFCPRRAWLEIMGDLGLSATPPPTPCSTSARAEP